MPRLLHERNRSRPRTRRRPALLAVAAVWAVSAAWLGGTPVASATGPPGVWPLQPQPEVVHGFDPPDVPWGSGHRGVDLAGRVGQPVHAALAGTVGFAGRVAGRGVVVVDHGDTRTTYQPVTPSVRRGEVVGRGQVIGTLAWFGTHCLPAPCLHWGLLAGMTYLDPLSLVGGPRPVRLLPLDGAAPLGVASTRSLPRTGAAALSAAALPAAAARASRPGEEAALAAVVGAVAGFRSRSREDERPPHGAHHPVGTARGRRGRQRRIREAPREPVPAGRRHARGWAWR
jgi:hypothetical protein